MKTCKSLLGHYGIEGKGNKKANQLARKSTVVFMLEPFCGISLSTIITEKRTGFTG